MKQLADAWQLPADYVVTTTKDVVTAKWHIEKRCYQLSIELRSDKAILVTRLPWCTGGVTMHGQRNQGYQQLMSVEPLINAMDVLLEDML